jgi:hypothetical protein
MEQGIIAQINRPPNENFYKLIIIPTLWLLLGCLGSVGVNQSKINNQWEMSGCDEQETTDAH